MAGYGMKVFAALQLLWIFTEGLGFFGLFLICYSIAVLYVRPWPWLEGAATFLSSFLTIFGAIVTVASVYLPQAESHPAWWHSRVFCRASRVISVLHRDLLLVRSRNTSSCSR
jgi:hypothetical protein